MIKQEITYVNLDEEEVTETFYFHLGVKKLTRMEESGEGLQKKLERVGKSGDGILIMDTFSDLIGDAFGVRGENGSFKQTPEASDDFVNSLAFEALLAKMVTDDIFAAKFVNGIMPKEMMDAAERVAADKTEKPKFAVLPGNPSDEESGLKNPRKDGALLAWAFREPNAGELQHMTKPQMADVMRRMSAGWKPPSPV